MICTTYEIALNYEKPLRAFIRIITAGCMAFAMASPVNAVESDESHNERTDLFSEDARRLEQEREARDREHALNAPSMRLQTRAPATYPALPVELRCVPIERIVLSTSPNAALAQDNNAVSQWGTDREPGAFRFAQRWVDHYAGQCIGPKGVQALATGVTRILLQHGYVTSSAHPVPQDLSKGTLVLGLSPGVIRAVRFEGDAPRAGLMLAFPTGAGRILNIRDLEQGLSSIMRTRGQSVTMRIEPADRVVGDSANAAMQIGGRDDTTRGGVTELHNLSDVVFVVRHTRPFSFQVGYDDGGSAGTGRHRGTVGASVSNLFGLNETFEARVLQDVLWRRPSGVRHQSGSFSIPFGYWTFDVSGGQTKYAVYIPTNTRNFFFNGEMRYADFRLQRVISRSASQVTTLGVRLGKRMGNNFADSHRLENQRRNETLLDLFASHRHYIGRGQADITLTWRQGLGWLGARPDPASARPEGLVSDPTGVFGTTRYDMMLVDASLLWPFRVSGQTFSFSTVWHGRYTEQALLAIDMLTIGNRFSVRGFDSDSVLAAEKGVFVRNDLAWHIGQTGAQLYLGVDAGHVSGASSRYLAGRHLVGAVLGFRGYIGSAGLGGVSYHGFAGKPIVKPNGMPTSRWVSGIELGYRF